MSFCGGCYSGRYGGFYGATVVPVAKKLDVVLMVAKKF